MTTGNSTTIYAKILDTTTSLYSAATYFCYGCLAQHFKKRYKFCPSVMSRSPPRKSSEEIMLALPVYYEHVRAKKVIPSMATLRRRRRFLLRPCPSPITVKLVLTNTFNKYCDLLVWTYTFIVYVQLICIAIFPKPNK